MSRPQQPQLIIFDWDGTIVNSANHIIECVRVATEKLHYPMPDEARIRSMIGLSLQVAISKLFPDIGATRQTEIFRQFRLAYFAVDQDKVPIYPEVESVLQHFQKQNVSMAIATGKSRQGLEHDLDLTRLRKYFIASRCGDETFSKPHPAMVLELLEELVIPPHESVVVGDSSYDILMAKSANVKSIAAAYGTHSSEELESCQPEYTIHSIEELKTLFV